ncbi:frizzled-1 [Lepeophtheirus salmonis]|uniref:Frizzledlike [Megachile rotundata] n=2 Tax=Lepeophtheirus salmonis TaxID=72036 RepID=A0A0K2VH93_LEPSM|nr:frizzled-1-like [Lepeophtheirus salmonis]
MIALILLLIGVASSSREIQHGKCEAIGMPLCRDLPYYNSTIFPNLLNHATQDEASESIRPYGPIVKLKCSSDFQLFLCSLYTPLCTILSHPIPPCKGLCLSAKLGCEDLMKEFDLPWHREFSCDHLPVEGSLCIGRERTDFSMTDLASYKENEQKKDSSVNNGSGEFICPAQLKIPTEREYVLRLGDVQRVKNCGAPCRKMFFNEKEIAFANNWIGLWSVLCLLSTSFTLLTFAVDPGRFPYPERPIIYLSICYFMISLTYIIGYASDDSIACNKAFDNDPSINVRAERTIKQGSLDDDWRCTLLAMILYFFTIASGLWWVILTISWFLSAGLKWGVEAIDIKSHWFHSIAWIPPSFLTVAILVTKRIDGDVLSGVCFVGLWDVGSLRYFILTPIFSCLVVGTFFLIIGMGSLVKIRTIMKLDGGKTDKLERLIARIGTFFLLYTIPAIIVISCLFYEQHHFSDWMILWQERICRDKDSVINWQIPCRYRKNEIPITTKPNFYIFMTKYLMFLMTGIFSGFWVWSAKTVVTWKNFYRKLVGSNPDSAYV